MVIFFTLDFLKHMKNNLYKLVYNLVNDMKLPDTNTTKGFSLFYSFLYCH